MYNEFYVNKVAVLGAGVMGAQIAAHFGNAGIPVVLFDLKSNSSNANELIEKAINNLKKLSPKPITVDSALDYITIANYDDNLDLLSGCNLIIEAIAERLDWKEALYHKIAPKVSANAILASNTSGLSIESLSRALPDGLKANFCGIHFFNPPRYMPLVELIPYSKTNPEVLPKLETFLVRALGKSVILAKDTPNFIANRLGVFSMLATCIHTEKYDIPLEVVDKLTGKDLGRAKSGTYRTADVVGLDTFAHVVKTMTDNCKDGFEACYKLPTWIQGLIDNGALGQKTKVGCYTKDKDEIKVFDLQSKQYRISDKKADPEVLEILKAKSWADKFEKLKGSTNPQAQFLWACFRDCFHYAAVLLGDIADSPREMDLAIRWGFGWKEGLFEIWQLAGFEKVANWIKEDIANGKSLSSVALPKWVFEQKQGVYLDNKYFNIKQNKLVERKQLPVYERQLFQDMVINERPSVTQHTIYENDGVRLWHTGDNVGILSFKSKMCSIGMDVLNGLEKALEIAQEQCVGMVIWQEKDLFSVGANLEEFGFTIMMNGREGSDTVIGAGHRVITQKLRYSKVPVVAAVKGYTFGGGCEIMLHCSAVVAALESYIGLIEAGVGLVPGWGGSTEMAYRASQAQDPWKDFQMRYQNLAMAKVATSALEARQMGFLRDSDTVVMNSREILMIAKEKVKYMANANYRPPLKPQFKVFGEQGIATVNGMLVNMIAGKQISEHDMFIAQSLAQVMCGGNVEEGTEVSQDWVLAIEKEKFADVSTSEKTAQRIQYMLENGKPLRN